MPTPAYNIRVASRHKVHREIRGKMEPLPFKCRVRFGVTKELQGDNEILLINTPEAITNAANKRLMKHKFNAHSVITAPWAEAGTEAFNNLGFPIVAKHIMGSRGTGNYLIKTTGEFESWKQGRDMNNYIFEKFKKYQREYRLHVSQYGCFYSCRKMLKTDTPQSLRWKRNDSNCVWIIDTNEKFDKPVNWDSIVNECVKAVKACGLDFGACDVKVQSSKKRNGEVRNNPKFFVIEINSAPSFGEITEQKYIQEIPEIAKRKQQGY